MIHFSFSKGQLKSLSSPHPLRDWVLLVGALFIIAVVLLVVSTQFFFKIRSGTIIGMPSIEQVAAPKVSRVELQRVVEALEIQRLNYEEGTIASPKVSDPSR